MHDTGNSYYMVLRQQQIMEKVEGWQPLQTRTSIPTIASSWRRRRTTWALRLAIGAGLAATLLGGAPQLTQAHPATPTGRADILDGPVLRETPDLAGPCAQLARHGFNTPITFGDPLRPPHLCQRVWMDLV